MATAVLQTRIDANIKREADQLFSSLGLDTTTAIRLFLKQAVNQQKIPFEILPPQPSFSEATLAAIEEARRIAEDSTVPSYTTARELLEDC
ncbi:MAG: type II toxin-antitoxin system RelB/DinJ family antitoxin [Treponema sp.]|nr:type II toxin-antitoxin system RelB/DinJ family antitoxin [Treponema sp.]